MNLRSPIFYALVAIHCLLVAGTNTALAQSKAETAVTALKTIDPEILQYFPRWRICEPDLQIQIRQTFALMGYDKANLDQQNIVITCAPLRTDLEEPEYDLILIECGTEQMVAAEIQSNMKKLSYRISDPKRPYCYQEIPPSDPPTPPQVAQIIDYMRPTNVNHAFTLSAFEQTLKVGKTGFWINSSIGTDQVGYTYWSSGEGRVTLQRPLYQNLDSETRRAIPYLINARFGFGYRMTGGLDGQNRFLDFVPGRKLNAGAGGKIVGGLDFHMPFHPQAGFAVNLELPLAGINPASTVDATTYAMLDRFPPPLPTGIDGDVVGTVALLRSTGQVTLFYNLWLDEKAPENFFRFDGGISYVEVREAALMVDSVVDRFSRFLTIDGVPALGTFRPMEVLDWVYFKAEYRNQHAFPFGVSLQYSNQILLGRAYIPLMGDWLYIEGRYATPLRDALPWERTNFFMVSPVLRLNF
jgi:hypothetical protein